ncbi:Guanine nucleotide-binding protein subunit gamma [Trametes pubescens]|uniref:Guanine nucleotide-binding protein subunit gamma n=1 Tax=Trametes pubescens TaxID=154538 RepID=A0A1M2W584_TRAPU|nr:Guanine nucleotide-binding protein subunit gamma [Trametes pubescens]
MNSRPHKQSMSELKLRRLTEHNQRLREDLARPRIRVSEASARCAPCYPTYGVMLILIHFTV